MDVRHLKATKEKQIQEVASYQETDSVKGHRHICPLGGVWPKSHVFPPKSLDLSVPS